MPIPKKCPGFTLIELMVAVALSAIVITAAYQVMVGQSRVYEAQEQTIDMQQNVRAALDFMCRELRMAGYGVSAGTDIFSNLINNDASDPNIDDGTDSITFVGNTDYGSLVVLDAAAGSNTVSVFPAPARTMEFKVGSVLDLLDGQKNLLGSGGLTVTGVTYGDPANPTTTPTLLTLDSPLAQAAPAGSYVTVQPRTISYRVNNRILQRNDGVTGWQGLIEDVEELQFVYAFDSEPDGDIDTDTNGIIWAVDTDNDGFLDTQVNADGSTAALASTVDITGDQANCLIRSVRVNILVRTARQDRSFPLIGVRPRVEDHAGAGTNDRFRRRLLQSIVKIRNLGLED